jgi:hypothetical protein
MTKSLIFTTLRTSTSNPTFCYITRCIFGYSTRIVTEYNPILERAPPTKQIPSPQLARLGGYTFVRLDPIAVHVGRG